MPDKEWFRFALFVIVMAVLLVLVWWLIVGILVDILNSIPS